MEEVRQKSWFSRNWGWLLGGGCLTVIVIGIIAIVGIVYKVSDAVTGSEPYTHAFAKAIENERVILFLGEPIETNGMGNTKYSYENGTTIAKLTIPVKGPKDEGKIVVDAEKINDEWAYYELYVQIDGEIETISLLKNEAEEPFENE